MALSQDELRAVHKARAEQQRRPLSVRFARHYTVAQDGCWNWTGAKDGKGYGQLRGLGWL